jgi:thiamine-phosphate pyrophosphorylase
MAIVAGAQAGLRAASRATIVQLRAPDLTAREVERELTQLVASSPVPVLVSSRCDLAVASGAAGVNLPERDIPIGEARVLVGDRLIGRSVHSLEAAREAEHDGADYVIFGPIWSSATHRDSEPVGIEALAAVVRAVRIPVLAIGGVTAERVADILDSGAAGYAAIRMFE